MWPERRYCGIDFRSWLSGFDSSEKAVRESVCLVAGHPLMPEGMCVRGVIIDFHTGQLTEVDCQ